MDIKEHLRRSFDFLRGRKTDYIHTFSTPQGKRVLADLAVFCRAAETCGVPGDHDKTFTLIGRNEVWQRIQNHLGLTPTDLLSLYDAPAVKAAFVKGVSIDD
jgi:hypothetical protein